MITSGAYVELSRS